MIANDNFRPRPAAKPAPSVEAWSGKDRGDENFPVGSVLIAAPLRAHVHAYYAFARNGDDIADSPALAPADKIARLDLMEEVLAGERDDGAPSAVRLRDSFAKSGVPDIHARELLIAFRRDATKTRYANWAELLDYCRYSAAPVGRFLLDLHGEAHTTWPASDALCASLQVLNHLQDCARDLRDLDRCYIPQDWLKHEGLSTDDLARAGNRTGAAHGVRPDAGRNRPSQRAGRHPARPGEKPPHAYRERHHRAPGTPARDQTAPRRPAGRARKTEQI